MKRFTCMSSPLSFTKPNRWIAHERDADNKKHHFAGEFESEEEAKHCVKNWNSKGGELVTMEWVPPLEEAEDSDRGTYIIRLTGTRFSLRINSPWHAMELAGERAKLLRNAIAKYGFTAVNEVLFAAQKDWTEHGWKSS